MKTEDIKHRKFRFEKYPETFPDTYPADARIKAYIAEIENRLTNHGYPKKKQELTNEQQRQIFDEKKEQIVFNYYSALKYAQYALKAMHVDINQYTEYFELFIRDLRNAGIPSIENSYFSRRQSNNNKGKSRSKPKERAKELFFAAGDSQPNAKQLCALLKKEDIESKYETVRNWPAEFKKLKKCAQEIFIKTMDKNEPITADKLCELLNTNKFILKPISAEFLLSEFKDKYLSR